MNNKITKKEKVFRMIISISVEVTIISLIVLMVMSLFDSSVIEKYGMYVLSYIVLTIFFYIRWFTTAPYRLEGKW